MQWCRIRSRGSAEADSSQKGRRFHYRKAQVSAKRDRDHITRHHTPRPNTGVEAVSDDVDQAALGDDFDLHVWIAAQIFEHDRNQNLPRRADGRIDLQRPGRLVAKVVYPFRRIGNRPTMPNPIWDPNPISKPR
jgi:hypothetical protein